MVPKIMTQNIWGVGRNYSDHAKEMQAPIPKKPLIFLKSGACLEESQAEIKIPSFTQNLHYEMELAVRLDAQLAPLEVALALDLTARDIQSNAKAQGQPWTLAKSFRGACPVSAWVPFQDETWFSNIQFFMKLNDQVVQTGETHQMIFSLPTLIEYLKSHFPVREGDIILTGTPAGVGSLKPGDQIQGLWDGTLEHHWKVIA